MTLKMRHERYPKAELLDSIVYFTLLYFLAGYVITEVVFFVDSNVVRIKKESVLIKTFYSLMTNTKMIEFLKTVNPPDIECTY